jgi:hypothetical protein
MLVGRDFVADDGTPVPQQAGQPPAAGPPVAALLSRVLAA